MKKAEKILYLTLAATGSAAALAVGFLKHNIAFWFALLFFALAVLYTLDRPVFAFRVPGFPLFPTKEDVVELLEDRMLWGDPEKRYTRMVRSFSLFTLLFGWGIVLYGFFFGQPL